MGVGKTQISERERYRAICPFLDPGHHAFRKQKYFENYEVSGRPTYYLIDPRGKIVCLSWGDLQKIETAIKKQLRDEKKL